MIDPIKRAGPSRLRVGLAAYSMREFLQAKPPATPKMDLLGFVDWAATLDTDAVELTSYFFPDPVTPEFLLELKRRCHLNGLDISGGAIRNNFTLPPGEELENWFKHLDKWLDYYAVLGAPVIRVFAGIPPKGVTEEQGIQNAITNMNRACEMAAKKGVILGLENHDYLTKIDRLVPIIKAVKSPWFGVNFDSGNVDSSDPYPELAKIAPYAVNVQLKVEVGPPKAKVPTDIPRVVKLLKDAGFRGYIVLEYESKPDPYVAIPKHLAELRAAIAAVVVAAVSRVTAARGLSAAACGYDDGMRYRQFGRLGWQVADIGYGMWGMGGWSGSEDTRVARRARPGGRARLQLLRHGLRLRRRPQRKAPRRDAEAPSPASGSTSPPRSRRRTASGRAAPSTPISQVFPYDYIVEMTEKSLKNLGAERLDLQQLHVWSDAWVEDDGWRRAAEDLKRDGKIEGFGISVNRWEPANVLKALDTGLVDAVQVVHNIFDQAPEDAALPCLSAPERRGHLARPVRRRQPDRHADRGHHLAGRRLPQHLLHAGQSEDDAGARRSPDAARPGRLDASRPRPALHPPSPRGVDDDPGHAEDQERRGQHRVERRPAAGARPHRRAPRPPVGSQPGPPVAFP